MDFYEHLLEAADQIANPDGYADDPAESDRRAVRRDYIYDALVDAVAPFVRRNEATGRMEGAV